MKIIDLFAGIGGIRRGFENAFGDSVKCVFTSEWDKYAKETYKNNYTDSIVHGDITKIDEDSIPDHDILLAGFPCQPFSQAGAGNGFLDTRGTLFFEIERILKNKKPSILFLENVKRLRNHDNGNTLRKIISTLNNIGYNNIHTKVLSAKDFGLPQNRERFYIVGFLNEDISFNFPSILEDRNRVGDILESKVNEKYTISDKIWKGHQRRKSNNILRGRGFGYQLFNENSEYTATITARYYKDGSEILIEQEGENPRKITPREAARLQGFPESFKICVSDTQAYKQFGNSVPVNVIEAIAKEIKKSIS